MSEHARSFLTFFGGAVFGFGLRGIVDALWRLRAPAPRGGAE